MATSVLKGGNFFKVQYRVVSFGQNEALVMVNKFVKFDRIMATSVFLNVTKGRFFSKFNTELCPLVRM